MKMIIHRSLQILNVNAFFLFLAFWGAGIAAAEQAEKPKLSIELNTLSQQDNACRLIFLVNNFMGKDLDKAVFETVLFKTDGSVDRLTLFDFQKLPVGRPRVRQFDIPGTNCKALGKVLINDVHACSGDGITGQDCIDALVLSTKTAVEVLG
jgi:hypothetical protein